MTAIETLKPIPRGLDLKILRNVVYERYRATLRNHNLTVTSREDLSDQFYETRRRLQNMGYDVSRLNDVNDRRRKSLHAEVRKFCEKALHKRRHEIGIFAADRAQFAFRGQVHNVNLENMNKLSLLGTDIILVEKEGIVDKLVPFTKDNGIALLQSQGFLSEYAEVLARLAARLGANLAILTDFDAQGINMGLQFPIQAVRIGIDLSWISGLDINDKLKGLEEAALTTLGKPSTNWVGLRNKLHKYKLSRFYIEYLVSYLEYLRNTRIELNSVMKEVGNEVFWNYLKRRILDAFPTRDYNRGAVDVYDIVYNNEWWELKEAVAGKISDILEDRTKQIRHELKSNDGIIDDVNAKAREIAKEQIDILNQNDKFYHIINGMVSLTNQIEKSS